MTAKTIYSKIGALRDRPRAAEPARVSGLRPSPLAVLSEAGIHFLLAAVLAGAMVFGERAPLGVAFVAAAGSGLFGASALVGACFGSLTALDFSTALAASTLAALAGWLILAWLCGPLLRKSCGKSRRHGV